MANKTHRIRLATLKGIADAIRTVKNITGNIPVNALADALRNGVVSTTTPTTTAEWCFIELQTLADIADVIRQIDKTTDKILVAELARRIRALAGDDLIYIKLSTPIINLYEDEAPPVSQNTTAILGKAILGLAILGNEVDDGMPTQKLATPVIYLAYDGVATVQLAQPVIELVVESGEEEPDVSIVQLATPVIFLYEEVEEPEEPDILTVLLATPVIDLYEETEEPDVLIVQLETPVIELVEIAEPEEPEEPDVPDILTAQLETPAVKLIDVTENAVKMSFTNDGYIDFNGSIVNYAGSGKRHSDIVAISDLANGPDGYCVQDFDTFEEYPKVLFFSDTKAETIVRGFTRTEIGDKDRLTVAEIKALAATVPDAKYVAFNSDYEDEGTVEDHVYIVEGAETFKPENPIVIVEVRLATPIITLEETNKITTIQLATPVISLYAVEEEASTYNVVVKNSYEVNAGTLANTYVKFDTPPTSADDYTYKSSYTLADGAVLGETQATKAYIWGMWCYVNGTYKELNGSNYTYDKAYEVTLTNDTSILLCYDAD